MRIVSRYLLGQFFVMLVGAVLFFSLLILLSDLLANFSKYTPMNVPIAQILNLSVLFAPQAISWVLPISLTFAVSMVMGNLYANNELVIVFGSGIPLWRFTAPLFLIGLLLSGALFFWNDQGVIPANKSRNETIRQLQGLSTLNNTNLALLSAKNRVVYSADYYNDQNQTLTGVVLLFRDERGLFAKRIDSEWADWKDNTWLFHKVRTYTLEKDGKISYRYDETWSNKDLDENPSTFQRKNVDMTELSFAEAGRYVESLKASGLPFLEQETTYLQRIWFSLAPFVAIWISAPIGGRLRKNIILLSLISSVAIASSYYVLQLILGLMAKVGILPTWLGAMAAMIVVLLTGVYLFSRART